jgi:predicted dehydrogenase
MKAGVIGTNWGRVHVQGLRKAGCDVIAMMAHDADLVAKIAMEEGIPTHGTDLSVFQDCDVVAIATPTASHLNYLEALQDKIILCEKPLGLTPDNQARFLALNAKRSYVSFPFPFLDSAKQLQQLINSGDFGELLRITVVAGVNLPYPKTPVEWFMEDMIHPISLLTHLFGDMQFLDARQGSGCNISAQMQCQHALVDLLLCPWPKPGLHFDITLIGSKNAYQLRGGFRPDRQWWMEPLMIDDVAQGNDQAAEDAIWIRANHRVANALIAHQKGEINDQQAMELGLFPLQRALAMEQSLLPLWQALAQYDQSPTLAGNMVWQTA